MKRILSLSLLVCLLTAIPFAALAAEIPTEVMEVEGVTVTKAWVDDIPVYYMMPEGNPEELKLCIYLSGLSGTKEGLVGFLPMIASRGYLGVVFDNYTSGERAPLTADGTQLQSQDKRNRAFANMYRHGWPILGQTVLDVSKVIDWFIANMGVSEEVVMAGTSMGGDISIAAAGFDERIVRIAPFITTPDWMRPGMHSLDDGTLMDPGEPDTYAQFFYDKFCPIVNLNRYKRGIPMLFVLGENDKHIPPENAERFKENLSRIAPEAAANIHISYTPGKAHAVPDDVNFVFDWLLLGKPLASEIPPAEIPTEVMEVEGVTVTKAWVDDIPVYYMMPEGNPEELKLCIYLSGLSGNKEGLVRFLPMIASRGYLGVVFDNYTHGERGPLKADGTQMQRQEIGARTFTNMYRYGWPILGQTVLDVSKVIDWFIANMGVSEEVVMAGTSMGGDISISAAGIDQRIVRIAPFITTPDWMRPGMHSLSDGTLMDPGEPDSYAQFFYDKFCPIVNLSRYKRGIPMLLVLGENDMHIPPENAERFKENLSRIAPEAAANIQISYTPGKAHGVPDDVNFVFDWLLLGKPIP